VNQAFRARHRLFGQRVFAGLSTGQLNHVISVIILSLNVRASHHGCWDRRRDEPAGNSPFVVKAEPEPGAAAYGKVRSGPSWMTNERQVCRSNRSLRYSLERVTLGPARSSPTLYFDRGV
jgi:hypothetical protein